MGWGCLGTDVLLPHLGFYLVPAQLPLLLLPLRGSAPLTGASACLTPVCWSTPGVLCCTTWFSPMCRALPQGLHRALLSMLQVPLEVFRSPGVCPSASLVTWVGLQPFPSFLGFSCSACLLG